MTAAAERPKASPKTGPKPSPKTKAARKVAAPSTVATLRTIAPMRFKGPLPTEAVKAAIREVMAQRSPEDWLAARAFDAKTLAAVGAPDHRANAAAPKSRSRVPG